MLLEAVECHVGIEQRILVVEPDDEAERQLSLRHRIDESATEFLVFERVAKRVDDGARFQAAGSNLPPLFEADRELLRMMRVAERQAPHQLFRQVAAHTVAENRHLREDIDAWLEGGLPLPMLVDAAVAGTHPEHPLAIHEDVLPGEARKEIDAGRF